MSTRLVIWAFLSYSKQLAAVVAKLSWLFLLELLPDFWQLGCCYCVMLQNDLRWTKDLPLWLVFVGEEEGCRSAAAKLLPIRQVSAWCIADEAGGYTNQWPKPPGRHLFHDLAIIKELWFFVTHPSCKATWIPYLPPPALSRLYPWQFNLATASTNCKFLLQPAEWRWYWQPCRCKFLSSIAEAPKEIEFIIDQLRFFTQLLDDIQNNQKILGPDPAIRKAVERCEAPIKELQQIADSLVPGFAASSNIRRKWTALTTVKAKEKMVRFQEKLHAAKIDLILARTLSSEYVQFTCGSFGCRWPSVSKVVLISITSSHIRSRSFRWLKDLLAYGICFPTSPRQLLCAIKGSVKPTKIFHPRYRKPSHLGRSTNFSRR